MYQAELTAALFPVFVHVYIYMHQIDQPDRARHFMAAHRTGHEQFYGDELVQLGTVAHRSQLLQIELIRNMVSRLIQQPYCRNFQ